MKKHLAFLVLAATVLAARASVNLIANPGFEAGNISGWTVNPYNPAGLTVVTSPVHSGGYAGCWGYKSQATQLVTGLTPNTTYTCFGWFRAGTTGAVYFNVENFGGTNQLWTGATNYSPLVSVFTTGPTNTTALVDIIVWNNTPGQNGYADDLNLSSTCEPATGAGPTLGDTNGTQAVRIADVLQRFGVNTFSLLTYDGYGWNWGGSAGNYDSATTARAINYLTGGSGLTMNIREYHHDEPGTPLNPLQRTWIREVYQATGSPFCVGIGMWGGGGDIPGIVSLVQDSVSSGLNYVKWVEGINEPDDPGVTITADTTTAVQASLYQQIHAISTNVIVAGAPIAILSAPPEATVTNYLGTDLPVFLSNSDMNDVHIYPQESPNANDNSGRGGQLADVDTAYKLFLPGKSVINSEFHPTYYSNIHKFDPGYDAYWGPIALLSATRDFDWQACFWFALFNYESSTAEGLFVSSDADPKPVAQAFRALFQLTGDSGTNKLTFQPGKIDVTISGLPAAPNGAPYAGGRWALFENSAQQYFLMIWNEQNNTNAATVPVSVTFNSHNMAKVEEFNITSGSEIALQSLTNVHAMTVNLNTSLRLLRITYTASGSIQGLTMAGNDPPTLFFAGLPGYGYAVQRSTNLTSWITIGTTNAPNGGSFSVTDSFSDTGGVWPSAAYYRLSW